MVEDEIPNHGGPLVGLLSGLKYVAANLSYCDHLASFPVDCPFYPKNFVRRLLEALQSKQAQIAVPRYGGQSHWSLGLWAVDLIDDLYNYLEKENQRKVQTWVEGHSHCLVDFDEERRDPFFNINTKQDLAQAEQRLLDYSLRTGP